MAPSTGDLKAKLQTLEEEYSIDRREFGKVLIIASAALLFVSVHSAIQFQSASQSINEVNNQFSQTEGIINSEGFNRSVQALESIKGTDIAPQFVQAAEAFNNAYSSLGKAEAAERRLERNFMIYQWLVLISLLGIVTGVAVIYI